MTHETGTQPPESDWPSCESHSVLRLFDANLNRCREGLRVIEDCCRFLFDEKTLTRRCKSLRHELSSWSKQFETTDLILMRDASGDVGRHSEQKSEYERENLEHLLKANFSRVQQALRALEEFSKTVNGSLGKAIESIRYESYELERSLMFAYFSGRQLESSQLYVLLDGSKDDESFRERARFLIDAGAELIQLRDKSLDDKSRLQRARSLVQMTRQTNVLAIINDRIDIAVAAGADGVHLGQDDLSPDKARRIVGPRMLIGLSTHSINQARLAEQLPVNYIGVGPTFSSNTKSFSEFTGPKLLKQVANEISIPAFAIGGIDGSNVAEVTATGIRRVAVAGAIDYSDRNSVVSLKAALQKDGVSR